MAETIITVRHSPAPTRGALARSRWSLLDTKSPHTINPRTSTMIAKPMTKKKSRGNKVEPRPIITATPDATGTIKRITTGDFLRAKSISPAPNTDMASASKTTLPRPIFKLLNISAIIQVGLFHGFTAILPCQGDTLTPPHFSSLGKEEYESG